jgi:hypothetical protein
MDTIPYDFSCYLLQKGLKKAMDVVRVLSEVALEDGELKVGLIA